MDFKKLDTISAAEKGFTYTFKDMDGMETDCTVDVIGVGSRIYKQAKAKIDLAEQASFKRGKPLDEDTSNELWIELLAKCVKGWTNVSEGDMQVAFSYDNAVRMFTSYPVFRNQVLEAIHDVRAMLEGN